MSDKKETPFRIGGVYRDVEGDLIRLVVDPGSTPTNDLPGAEFLNTENGRWEFHGGRFNPDTGECNRYPWCNLIPGELVNVSGEWVPAGNGGIVIRDNRVEDCCLTGIHLYPAPRPGDFAKRDSDSTGRPALEWNKPTPFDPFPGFAVTLETEEYDRARPFAGYQADGPQAFRVPQKKFD